MATHTECLYCGSADVETALIELPSFSGMPSVTLINVPQTSCKGCGETVYTIPRQGRVFAQIREKLCSLRRPLAGREIAFLRQGLKRTGTELARTLKVSNVTLSRWENDEVAINGPADGLLRALTMASLGKGKFIQSVLESNQEHGVEEVVVDVSEFTEIAYIHRHTTVCWGGVQGGTHPWVINNLHSSR